MRDLLYYLRKFKTFGSIALDIISFLLSLIISAHLSHLFPESAFSLVPETRRRIYKSKSLKTGKVLIFKGIIFLFLPVWLIVVCSSAKSFFHAFFFK